MAIRAPRKPYPSDVSDEEWQFVAPYFILMTPEAGQRRHDLREVFNALRWLVKSGAHWRMMPNHLPPWPVAYQQTQRWFKSGCFEAIAHDFRILLRLDAGSDPDPTGAIFDSRTLQSTPESGTRAGNDGAKRRKGSKVHLAVDTLGHLLALHVTPASEQDREQVGELAQEQAEKQGIALMVVKHTETKKGFVLLPRRWEVERSFGWVARFRRLARDYECLAESLKGLDALPLSA